MELPGEGQVALKDRGLVRKVLEGDTHAQEAFAVRYRGDLLNLFLWLTRDPDLAENLTQDTFLRVWERLGQFRGESGLRTWVHRVALSLLADHRRSEVRKGRALEDYARSSVPEGQAEQIRRAEMRAALAHALAELPEDERRVVVLCKLQGFTLAEAAGLLGEPVGTLAWRMAEGLKQLRALLSGARDSAADKPARLAKEATHDVSQGS